MVQVEIDPIAHRIVSRELVKSDGSCAICGEERMRAGKPTRKLWVYMLTAENNPRLVLYKGYFCSSKCWNEYWMG